MPLYKKGPNELPSNFRPISLLSCVGKIDERIVFKRMYNFFHANNIHSSPSGFLPGYSAVYQLLDIYHQITQCIDAKYIHVSYFVMSKLLTEFGTWAYYSNDVNTVSMEN